MPKVKVKKAVCGKCGVDVRDKTLFCYNCGSPVVEIVDEPVAESNGEVEKIDGETRSALDDLAEKLKNAEPEDRKLAKAAAERKKARFIPRKTKEFVWEPNDESPSRLLPLIAILVAVIAAGIVFLTVYWK